jgi:hypothetical protein
MKSPPHLSAITQQQFYDLDSRVLRVMRDRRRAIPLPALDMLDDLALLTYGQARPFLLLEPGTFLKFWNRLCGRDQAAISRAMQWLKDRDVVIEYPEYKYWINPNFREWRIASRQPLDPEWSQYCVTLELPPDPLDLKVIMREIALERATLDLSAPDLYRPGETPVPTQSGNQERPPQGSRPGLAGEGDKREENSRSNEGCLNRAAADSDDNPAGGSFNVPVHFAGTGEPPPEHSRSPSGKLPGGGAASLVLKSSHSSGSPGPSLDLKTSLAEKPNEHADETACFKNKSPAPADSPPPARARESFSDKALIRKAPEKLFKEASEGLAEKPSDLPPLVRMRAWLGDRWTTPNEKGQLDGEKWERRYAKNRVKVERVVVRIEERLARIAKGKSEPIRNFGALSEFLWQEFTTKRFYEHHAK